MDRTVGMIVFFFVISIRMGVKSVDASYILLSLLTVFVTWLEYCLVSSHYV